MTIAEYIAQHDFSVFAKQGRGTRWIFRLIGKAQWGAGQHQLPEHPVFASAQGTACDKVGMRNCVGGIDHRAARHPELFEVIEQREVIGKSDHPQFDHSDQLLLMLGPVCGFGKALVEFEFGPGHGAAQVFPLRLQDQQGQVAFRPFVDATETPQGHTS